MIGAHDAAVLRRVVELDAANHVRNRLALEATLATISGAEWVAALEAQVRAAGFTDADAAAIIDEAIAIERRRRPVATTLAGDDAGAVRRPTRPTILRVGD